MNSGALQILRRAALSLVLLLQATVLTTGVLALGQRPSAGEPPSREGKPGAMPPKETHVQGTAPAGMPPAVIHPLPLTPSVPIKKTPAGEQFFIVASVDLQKSQLLLKYPTEVTLLMRVDGSTKFADESGKPLKLSDFRAGDTVWVTSANEKGDVAALRVRKGGMGVADLHRYYLNYAEIK
jgi:hypothetical protein